MVFELGGFHDPVAHVVEHRIELIVDDSLSRRCGRTKAKIVNLHERDQVTERRRFDHAQLVECFARIRPFEHSDQASDRLEKFRCFLISLGPVERRRRSLERSPWTKS